MDIKVYPGILEQEREEFLDKLEKAGEFAEGVMIDVIDGKFSDNLTVGMEEVMEAETNLTVGLHLQTDEPVQYLHQAAEMGATLAMGQIELMEDQKEFLNLGIKLGLKPGLALDLLTPIDFIEEEALAKTKRILLLAVEGGYSEQAFDGKVLEKIMQLRDLGFEGDIWVDGGVNRETISACAEAGANAFSVTSGIWRESNPQGAWRELEELARESARR